MQRIMFDFYPGLPHIYSFTGSRIVIFRIVSQSFSSSQLVLAQYIDIALATYLIPISIWFASISIYLVIIEMRTHISPIGWKSNIILLCNLTVLPHSKRCSTKPPLRVGLIWAAKMHEHLISLCSLYEPRCKQQFCAIACNAVKIHNG